MSTNFIEPIERLASDALDGLADALVGKASSLRDGTEHAGVELPRDLYAHANAQTEWWYYTGSARKFFLKLGDWTVREAHGLHLLRATLGDDLVFEAALRPTKPAALNGREGTGVSFKDAGEASRYFSYTRMSAEGEITWRGETERFAGEAWMDREFGTWRTTENQKGWDWFSVQLSTGAEVMVYHLRDSRHRPSAYSSGTFVDAEGKATHLAREGFTLEATGRWKSPRTGATYPSGWRLTVPRFAVDVLVTPVLRDQELDTRGTTMIVYWEGACAVSGRHGDAEIEGRAYVELVGYDRSHESPSITTFLFGSALGRGWRSIFG
ncbi:MAG: hypothetical protein LC746_13470 [Acidobacteria bacterium]|nr:hypothetical protein [Acidobacteriota bacterium]